MTPLAEAVMNREHKSVAKVAYTSIAPILETFMFNLKIILLSLGL